MLDNAIKPMSKIQHNPPTTSLIITTYNRKDALELVLLSALRQTVPPTEIIIADDGSRDDTRQLVDSYRAKTTIPIIHAWHEDTGFRLSAIRNLAISKSHGDYIILVDGDIILHKEFIKSHLSHAKANRFIQGSRVMLKKRLTQQCLTNHQIDFSFFQLGIKKRFNNIYFPPLSSFFSYSTEDDTKVRGCNLSFWRADVLEVNGFNEDFVGWGREDTEFMIRMLNSGKQFYKIKLGGFGYHLHHPISSRVMLEENKRILSVAIANKSKRCVNGVDKYNTD